MITIDYGLLSEFNELQDSKVFNYLTDKLEEVKTQLVNVQEESTFRTLQGRALMLSEIINSINTSRDKMMEFRKNKPVMNNVF